MDRTPATPARAVREYLIIVDDEDHLRFGLSLTLRKEGFQVAVASNGIEALQLIRERADRPDAFALMVLDLRMPLMSGAQLMAVLEADGIHLPAIGITGCVEPESAPQLAAAGCLHVLHKPFPTDELLKLITAVLVGRPTVVPAGGTEAAS
jgi:CheY-like chemotaxis protein